MHFDEWIFCNGWIDSWGAKVLKLCWDFHFWIVLLQEMEHVQQQEYIDSKIILILYVILWCEWYKV